MPNPGDVLENHVRQVYETLLNLRDEGVLVSARTRLRGRSGVFHHVDVYYEFERAGVLHRVAIECKNTERLVEKAELLEFHAKINDIPNVIGLVVARMGFQQGFREYADHHGLRYMTQSDLPNIGQLMGIRLDVFAFPDEHAIGEPFWCLMEVRDGELTGSHFARANPDEPGIPMIPLFFSRPQAYDFLMSSGAAATFVVRGLPQHVLRNAIVTAEFGQGSFIVMFGRTDAHHQWGGKCFTPSQIAKMYYLKENPVLELHQRIPPDVLRKAHALGP